MNGVTVSHGTEAGRIQILHQNNSGEKSKTAFEGEGGFEETVFYPLSPVQMSLYYSFHPEIDIL